MHDVAPLTRPLSYLFTTAAHCGAKDSSAVVPGLTLIVKTKILTSSSYAQDLKTPQTRHL